MARKEKKYSEKEKREFREKMSNIEKGALTRTVKREYGRSGFDKDGRIKETVLDDLSKREGITGKRAKFAESMRGWRHRGRKEE